MNRVLRRMFVPQRDGVTGNWKKTTHYCSGDPIKKNGIGRACNIYGGGEWFMQGFGGET